MSSSTLADQSSSALDAFHEADVRNQLFDVRALASSGFALLDCVITQDIQADASRMMRMIIENVDAAIMHINNAETLVMKHKKSMEGTPS